MTRCWTGATILYKTSLSALRGAQRDGRQSVPQSCSPVRCTQARLGRQVLVACACGCADGPAGAKDAAAAWRKPRSKACRRRLRAGRCARTQRSLGRRRSFHREQELWRCSRRQVCTGRRAGACAGASRRFGAATRCLPVTHACVSAQAAADSDGEEDMRSAAFKHKRVEATPALPLSAKKRRKLRLQERKG